MATREIPQNEWTAYFNEFSRMHQGEQGTLREIGPDTGDQIQAEQRAFVGISSDYKGSEPGSITVILGTETGDNVERTIAAPTSVFVREGDGETDSADVEIRQEEGSTLILQLTRIPALTGAR